MRPILAGRAGNVRERVDWTTGRPGYVRPCGWVSDGLSEASPDRCEAQAYGCIRDRGGVFAAHEGPQTRIVDPRRDEGFWANELDAT